MCPGVRRTENIGDSTGSGLSSAAPALVEVYDSLAGASGSLRNLSLRSRVEAADETPIVGFVLYGNGPVRVLIRAVGPGLTRFGVSGVIPDPLLWVHSSSEPLPIAYNTGGMVNADTSRASESVGAFPLARGDAAVVLRLSPGAYTAEVTSISGTSGEVLIEVYVLD